MTETRTLTLVSKFSIENDSHFVARALPLFQGSGPESRLCGGCGGEIVRNVTVGMLYANLQGFKRVVITCVCGAHNLLVEERRAVPRG